MGATMEKTIFKTIRSRLARFRRGVRFFGKYPRNPGYNGFRQLHIERHGSIFRGVVREQSGSVSEVWDTNSLNLLRSIACAYYPSLCHAFGPARLYVGI